MHAKSIHSTGVKQNLNDIRKYLDKDAQHFHTNGKRKYLYPISQQAKEYCKQNSKPYPKKIAPELSEANVSAAIDSHVNSNQDDQRDTISPTAQADTNITE
jgi:hypothetical protein